MEDEEVARYLEQQHQVNCSLEVKQVPTAGDSVKSCYLSGILAEFESRSGLSRDIPPVVYETIKAARAAYRRARREGRTSMTSHEARDQLKKIGDDCIAGRAVSAEWLSTWREPLLAIDDLDLMSCEIASSFGTIVEHLQEKNPLLCVASLEELQKVKRVLEPALCALRHLEKIVCL